MLFGDLTIPTLFIFNVFDFLYIYSMHHDQNKSSFYLASHVACKVQLVVNTREHTPLSLDASAEHAHDA